MAKPQVYNLSNGATLVYQKQGSFNGYSFAIGFRGGAQLDGKHEGLSHLLEHLLFRTPNTKSTNQLLDNIIQYTINQNAFTSQYALVVTFSSVYKNIDAALANCMNNMLTRRKFTQEQINHEIDVVKHEINLDKDELLDYVPSATEILLKNIQKNYVSPYSFKILGSPNTLKTVTPQILTEYMKRYFNLDNLIVSVTTNKPLENVLDLCEKHIFSKLQNATSEKYIVPPPPNPEFINENMLVAIPDPDLQTVSFSLFLKERSFPSEDIHQEYAYDIIEEYLMNYMGGYLWDALRVKNQLVYAYGLQNLDFETVKFKNFYASTTAPKMRKTISEICKIIRRIGQEGVPQKDFAKVKKVLCDANSATLNKLKRTSASSNFTTVLNEIEFIDYKKVNALIEKMTWEEFNAHIMPIYSLANVSVALEGNFDSRKCYTLIEIEKMLGNYLNVEQEYKLNLPRIEATPKNKSKQELVQDAITAILVPKELQNDNKKDNKNKGPVTIDNQPVK